MRQLAIGVILLAIAATAAKADAIDIGYESFYRDRDVDRTRIILKLTNNTGQTIDTAFVECAFLDGDQRAVDTSVLIGKNLTPAAAAYVSGWSSQRDDIKHVTCRVTRYR